MEKDFELYARQFKAFCDPNRLQIIHILLQGEQCACNIQDNVTIGQSTLSHHMKILIDSGMVISRKEGKWVHYSLSDEGIKDVRDYLSVLLEKNNALNKACICKGNEG